MDFFCLRFRYDRTDLSATRSDVVGYRNSSTSPTIFFARSSQIVIVNAALVFPFV